MSRPATTAPLLFALSPHPLAPSLCQTLGIQAGVVTRRSFPDGESYLRVDTPVKDRPCIVLAELAHPDGKYLPLVFLLATLREFGASSVGLIAPYLSYMRQDRRFVKGEALTSRIFANLLSTQIDWLVTVDPHLHRYRSLDDIYSVPTRVVQGAPALANWLKGQTNLLLVGPDAESEQWVADIARRSGHPFVVGAKQRYGDRDVMVTLPDLGVYRDCTVVIIDDVISSGHTVLKCMEALQQQGIAGISCAAIHGIFAEGIDKTLIQRGLQQLITTNSIAHSSSVVDLTDSLLEPIREFISVDVGRSE